MSVRSTRLPGPRGVAQVGYLRQLFSDPRVALERLRDDYGPVCGLGFGPVRTAIVGEAAAVSDLFAQPNSSYRWGHKFNVLGFVVGPGSMIVSDGEEHDRRRGSVQQAFARKRLNGWIPGIVEQTDIAIDRLELRDTSRSVDLYPVGRALVLEVVVRAFFGERFAGRAAEIGALFQAPQDYLEGAPYQQLPHPLPFGKRARVRRDRRAIDRIVDTAIADCRRRPSGDPLDVLEALVQHGTLSDAEIRDQVVTLIGAGYDTTAASLAWVLWRAATEPGVWAMLRAEADEVLGPIDDAGGPARDHTTLNRLAFANRVMRETLRLHPAGVIAPRETAVDVRVGANLLRKGTLVLWSPYLVGRDAAVWPDPLRFDPGRFEGLAPHQKVAADSAWVPFGGGTRNCVGFGLAQMELTLMTARLAQRLDVTPAPGATVPLPVGTVVNRPAGGVPMTVAHRTS